ncbi:MAG: alpha/beta fold hydrolase [Anaerolineales bacterium]|nr:alpha/beta fold hydrolase [Anaerolineales bacterium]
MSFRKITFPNSEGLQLGARLDLPAGRPTAYALFAHCFTCSKELQAVDEISQALTGEGIAVFRFDFTGLGESEGEFADTNFSSNVADLVTAAAFMAAEYEGPQLLIGHSLGGAAVLQAAGSIPSARAVATIGAPSDPDHVQHLLVEALPEIEARGEARVRLAGREFNIKKQLLEDLERTNMQETIANLRKALLVMHGPLDNIVSIDNAAEIFKAAKHPKSFVTLDQADHLLSNPDDACYTGKLLAAWALKYIETAPADTSWHDDRVAVRTADGYYTEVYAQGHNLIADESIKSGGTDQGPDPYGFLLGGLGACTSITLRMYADRKGWPLESIVVRLSHEKIRAQDCEECETKEGRVDRITRDLILNGPLDEEQLARLVEIADRCPVHRTLRSETVIKTNLVRE